MIEFIIGFLSAQFLLPLLDSILSLIMTKIEILKGKDSIRIAEYNQQVMNVNDSNPKSIIGFTLPNDEESYNDD